MTTRVNEGHAMSDELKPIKLSKEKDDVMQQTLRSPLADRPDINVGPRAKEKSSPVGKTPDKAEPSPQEAEGSTFEDNYSSLNKLKFRTDEKKESKFGVIGLGVLLLTLCSIGALWLFSPNSLKKFQKALQLQSYKIQEKSLSLLDIFEGKNTLILNKFKTDQQTRLRGLIAQQASMSSDGTVTATNCEDNSDGNPSHHKNKWTNKLTIVDCYLYHDYPLKALHFKEMPSSNFESANQDDSDVLDAALDLQIKYRLWYPSSTFKSIRFGCNRWEPKEECALRVVLDGYFKSALSPEKGFQAVKAIASIPPLAKVYLWLSSGRIAMFDGRNSVAEDRFMEAERLVPHKLPGLMREIMEARALSAYYAGNKLLLKQIVDKARMIFPPPQKGVLARMEFMQSLLSAKDTNQKKSIMIRFLAPDQWDDRMWSDPWFFNVLSFEANLNNVQEPYLSYLSRIKQIYGSQKEIPHHVNLLLDQWTIRTALAAKQYQNVKVLLAKYQKEFGADAFSIHYNIALQIRSHTGRGTMQLTGDIQQALEQKEKLPWPTQYLLGIALISSNKLAEVPGLLNSFEDGASTLDSQMNLFLLKVEYLIAQNKFELALKNLDLFSSKYPDSLRALLIKQNLLLKLSDSQGHADVKRRIDILQNSDKYRDNLRMDPLGPFVLID